LVKFLQVVKFYKIKKEKSVKKIRNLMILLMMIAGVNLSASAPTNGSHVSGKFTCPTGKSVVSIKETHQQGCCPSCPAGKVARVDDKFTTNTHKCVCRDKAHIDQRYR
jgi:hypothetical protein